MRLFRETRFDHMWSYLRGEKELPLARGGVRKLLEYRFRTQRYGHVVPAPAQNERTSIKQRSGKFRLEVSRPSSSDAFCSNDMVCP